jgi:hypothetical protein
MQIHMLEERAMRVDDPKLLRDKAAECQKFARSSGTSDVAAMLSRLADDYLARAMRAERQRGDSPVTLIRVE